MNINSDFVADARVSLDRRRPWISRKKKKLNCGRLAIAVCLLEYLSKQTVNLDSLNGVTHLAAPLTTSPANDNLMMMRQVNYYYRNDSQFVRLFFIIFALYSNDSNTVIRSDLYSCGSLNKVINSRKSDDVQAAIKDYTHHPRLFRVAQNWANTSSREEDEQLSFAFDVPLAYHCHNHAFMSALCFIYLNTESSSCSRLHTWTQFSTHLWYIAVARYTYFPFLSALHGGEI